jgi:hypothetical protein
VTKQNQNNLKVRIEKSLIPVAMSLILAAAVLLLILVAVMLIPAVVMSILAVVKNTLFFLKGPEYILGPFLLVQCSSINGPFVQSLRLPCGMRSLFLWGLCSKNNPRNINYMPACPVGPADRTGVDIFFACLFIPFFQRGILNKNPHL